MIRATILAPRTVPDFMSDDPEKVASIRVLHQSDGGRIAQTCVGKCIKSIVSNSFHVDPAVTVGFSCELSLRSVRLCWSARIRTFDWRRVSVIEKRFLMSENDCVGPKIQRISDVSFNRKPRHFGFFTL